MIARAELLAGRRKLHMLYSVWCWWEAKIVSCDGTPSALEKCGGTPCIVMGCDGMAMESLRFGMMLRAVVRTVGL